MMPPQKQQTTIVPASIESRENGAIASFSRESRAHRDEEHLAELLSSRVVRQALQPVAERLLAFPSGGIFCVASAEPDEGRTLVATALGLILSEKTDRNVLLVDAHMQKPAIHALLGVPRAPGLADCLLEERRLQDGVSLVGTLSVLPAGRDGIRPRLLRTATAKRLLEEIARKYDLALIDLPPLTPSAADAAALCDWSQGTIVVVRANATRASTLARAVEMIDSNKVLGVVLNQEQDDMPRWLQRLL